MKVGLVNEAISRLNLYLLLNKKNNEFFRELCKIVSTNEGDPQKQKEMLGKIRDLVRLTVGDSLEKLEDNGINKASFINRERKVDMLEELGALETEEAVARVAGEINYLYNPCQSPVEKWVDLETNYWVYHYHNQKALASIRVVEALSKVRAYDTRNLRQCYVKLVEAERELRADLEKLRPEFCLAPFQNEDKVHLEKVWLEGRELLGEKINSLRKTEDLLERIIDLERSLQSRSEEDTPERGTAAKTLSRSRDQRDAR